MYIRQHGLCRKFGKKEAIVLNNANKNSIGCAIIRRVLGNSRPEVAR